MGDNSRLTQKMTQIFIHTYIDVGDNKGVTWKWLQRLYNRKVEKTSRANIPSIAPNIGPLSSYHY